MNAKGPGSQATSARSYELGASKMLMLLLAQVNQGRCCAWLWWEGEVVVEVCAISSSLPWMLIPSVWAAGGSLDKSLDLLPCRVVTERFVLVCDMFRFSKEKYSSWCVWSYFLAEGKSVVIRGIKIYLWSSYHLGYHLSINVLSIVLRLFRSFKVLSFSP